MKFKKQVFIEVVVGLFTVIVLGILLALTTVLSEELLFKKYTFLEVRFDQVSGLRTGDEVNARGVAIGKVKHIELQPGGVHVWIRLDMDIDLRADYRITVQSSSVLGGHLIRIDEGSPTAEPVALTELLEGSPAAELMESATQTVQDIQNALNDGILDDLKAAMAQIRRITESINEGGGTMNRLLKEGQLYDDIEQIAANVRTISAAIANGEGTLGKLVMDDEVYGELRDIAANLGGISDRLANGESTIGKLLGADDQVYQDLAATMAEIRTLAETVGRGEGSVGKLLTDDELYQQIQALMREGRATLDDLRETSPVTTFTSIFFGAF